MGFSLWEMFLRTPGTFAIGAALLIAVYVFVRHIYGGGHD